MSDFPHLDSKTLLLLDYISKNDYCNVRTLLHDLNIKQLSESPDTIASLLHFIDKGFVALLLTSGKTISTYNFHEYFNQCLINQKAVINADYQLFMLPEGRYIIEEITRQKRYFNIPLIISVISASVSAFSLLYQIFDNSPILVKIIEYLPWQPL